MRPHSSETSLTPHDAWHTSPGLSGRQEESDPRGTNPVWQSKTGFHTGGSQLVTALRAVSSHITLELSLLLSFWWEQKKIKNVVASSEFPSCSLHVQEPWQKGLCGLTDEVTPFTVQKTEGFQSSGRCSSAAALKTPAWCFIVTHADKRFIDISWIYGDSYESSCTGRHVWSPWKK